MQRLVGVDGGGGEVSGERLEPSEPDGDQRELALVARVHERAAQRREPLARGREVGDAELELRGEHARPQLEREQPAAVLERERPLDHPPVHAPRPHEVDHRAHRQRRRLKPPVAQRRRRGERVIGVRVRARDVAEVVAADVAERELDDDRQRAVVEPVERRLEQLRRLGETVLVVADLGQQPQGVAARRVARRVVGDRLEQRPRPRPVACVDVQLRRAHAAPAGRLRIPGQSLRLLEQLGGGVPRPAGLCVRRGALDRRGDLVVSDGGREREVARPLLGIRDQLREPPVDRAAAAGRGRGVDGGSVQRVREPHAVATDPQQPGVLGDCQAVRGGGQCCELDGGVRQRGDDQQRLASARRQRRDTLGDRLPQAGRDRERAAGLKRGSRSERARNLEREQRVAARGLFDPQQRRPPVAVPQAALDQGAERAEAERAEPDPLEALAPQRALKPQHVG